MRKNPNSLSSKLTPPPEFKVATSTNTYKRSSAMFNIIIKPEHNLTGALTESAQYNPLRWRIMYREKDKLTSQAQLMKCKDYFNDLVALRKGHVFSVYGFKNDTVKFNKWGLYILLTDVMKADQFIENVNSSINVRLKADMQTTIRCWKQDNTSVVIRIPNKMWESTYYISLLTMMLRVCNNNVEFSSWDDLYSAKSPLNTIERSFTEDAKRFTHLLGFKLPIDTWYYYNSQYNGMKDVNIAAIGGSTIHNNGCSAWCSSLPADIRANLISQLAATTTTNTEEVPA